MKELIQGAYDLHVHSAPDVMPRKMDDLEMAQRIVASGMAGYALKSGQTVPCTASRPSTAPQNGQRSPERSVPDVIPSGLSH